MLKRAVEGAIDGLSVLHGHSPSAHMIRCEYRPAWFVQDGSARRYCQAPPVVCCGLLTRPGARMFHLEGGM
jgi:hypothetical protein